jgi:predicted nucleic acid-binding protein
MIVADSSVWIGQLRGLDNRAVRKLTEVQRAHRAILIGDLILLEVLQGARDDAHALRLERDLRKFKIESMLGDDIAVKAATNYRILRGRGITVRKTVDLIIATFCIERGHSLLHDDRDFDAIAPHVGLSVV